MRLKRPDISFPTWAAYLQGQGYEKATVSRIARHFQYHVKGYVKKTA